VWSTGDEGVDPKLVNTLGAGDHFGEVGLLEGMPSTATVRTVSPTSLLRVSATAFLEIAASSPRVLAGLIERVGGALARSHPAYQPAAEAAVSDQSPAQLLHAIDERLRSLSGQSRSELISALKKVIEEAERSS
jgi:CRP-like cAMP-binding protein